VSVKQRRPTGIFLRQIQQQKRSCGRFSKRLVRIFVVSAALDIPLPAKHFASAFWEWLVMAETLVD